MELITGYQLEDHVTSLQDAMWHRGIWKDDCIISVGENLKAEITTNNEIRVRSGILNMQGKFCSIDMNTYDSLTINNGTAGENRIDLIVARYEKNNETQVEDVRLKVIQGTPSLDTPSVPSYTEGNIDNGDLIAELPLYEVHIEGINITKVECVIEVQPPVSLARNKLFEGAIKTGDITLNDNISNYRFLIIGCSAVSGTSTYTFGLYFVISDTPKVQVVAFFGNPDPQHHVTYFGKFINSTPNTLTVSQAVTNVIHKAGENHSGSGECFITEVIGIR
ncbi:hypothetical protein [Anaerofustis butyriciformans]|uniref:hypothetical protein n=1 Tax=Anaerofustis butyriciformans TaxID=3108533 RepID=UPI002E2F90C0|nr:hypothetical protein [Anaerofustis sp. HA2171]